MKGILLSFSLLLLSGNAYAIETGSDLLNACEAFERNATISSDGRVHMNDADAFICFGFMNAVWE